MKIEFSVIAQSTAPTLSNGGLMKRSGFCSVLAASLMLPGCASTDKVMSKEATEVFHSAKSQNEVTFCLADKNHSPALDRDDGSKVVLIKNNYGGVSMAFTIFPDGTGSRIELRKQFGTIGTIWKKCIGLDD